MSHLKPDDRVELADITLHGTVIYADKIYVKVRWDNGKIGLLYYGGGKSKSDARLLLKLKGKMKA